MPRERGLFIVLEGADGCGKSTQAERLSAELSRRGGAVRHVRDPGSTRVAEGVRRLLLDPATGDVDVRAETFLYLAARAQLAAEVIEPSLASGTHVVCERWTLSTEVYQGVAGGLGADVVRRLAGVAEGAARPDLTLLLDVDVGEGLARLGGEHDRMEAKGARFHADVVRGYRELASARDAVRIVPPGGIDAVTARVLREVDDVLAG